MINISKLVLTLPSILPFNYEVNTKYDLYSYSFCVVCEPQLIDLMPYYLITNEDLVRENNNRIMDQMYEVDTNE